MSRPDRADEVVTRRTLFDGGTLQVSLFEANPRSDACGEVERQSSHAVVLPVSGVFAKHEAPGRYVVGTPSHAVLFRADTPYQIGYPGAIGDRALTFRFAPAAVPKALDARDGSEMFAPHGLLPARAMMLRNLLRTRLARGDGDTLAIEALGLELVGLSLGAMRIGNVSRRRMTQVRRKRALERVKEAVASAPARKWSIAALADIAHLSPFHLCHVFRQAVGTSIYDYVLRERLAQALDAVLDGNDDLTAVALDAGFSSHSHFTARFRSFFGCTPAALRRVATAAQVGEMRKIMTATRSAAHVA